MTVAKIGAYEAKTHLGQLLDRVLAGERIVITRHGVEVAELIPARPVPGSERAKQAAQRIRELRKGRTTGGMSIQDMIREGRKW
jgi:prevent-host-death family protein